MKILSDKIKSMIALPISLLAGFCIQLLFDPKFDGTFILASFPIYFVLSIIWSLPKNRKSNYDDTQSFTHDSEALYQPPKNQDINLVNPASGLPMNGGVDSAGNSYGFDTRDNNF